MNSSGVPPTGTRTAARPAARTGVLALAACAVGTAVLAGCGIRATTVPVDAGAAPSRVGCVLPGEGGAESEAGGNPEVRVYLVCGSRVSPVERRVAPRDPSGGGRLEVARKLLEQLQREPHGDERSAGFTTDVPEGLEVSGPLDGDPADTLRLNTPPEKLPAFTLAQIVCTYADASSDRDGDADAVTLGGPPEKAGEASPRRYECGTALRNRPDAARTAGMQP